MGRIGWRNLKSAAARSGLALAAVAAGAGPLLLVEGAGGAAPTTAPTAAPSPGIDEPVKPSVADAEVIDPADTLELAGLQKQFEEVARHVGESVVSISAVQSHPEQTKATEDPAPDDRVAEGSALRSDEMNPQKLQEILDQSTRTVGTGFVVDPDGYILTNEHVIDQSLQCWVTTADHKVWPAVVVGSDPRADLAVLKIPASHLTPVKFAGDENYQRGEWTIALGNPYGLATDGEPSMSVGVIAATDRSLPRLAVKEDRLYSRLIQTTAQINPGNSGGPLFDIQGQVIGVNTAVILPQKQINGIGFAIPVTPHLLSEVNDLEQGREVIYGYLGVTVVEPTATDRAAGNTADGIGVRVEETEKQSPSDDTLQRGDLLISFNGQTIHDCDQFVRMVGDAPVGRPVQMGLVRKGKTQTAAPIPTRRPLGEAAVTRDTQRFHWRGALIGPVTPAENASVSSGLLVVGLDDDSPMKKDGVHIGSIITSVAGQKLSSLVDLLKIINDIPEDRCVITLAAANLPATTQPATAK